jgi:2-phospho-L-lactate guanylyltransferase (CobY/MobA/RfbA family)
MTQTDALPSAIVIAGGEIHDPLLAQAVNVKTKAEIDFHGRAMVWWVVDALKSCGRIGRVVVVAAPACRDLVPNADIFLEQREDETSNIFAGIEALEGSRRILMSSGDVPLLTCNALQDFLDNAPDADIVYPIVEQADIVRQFPDREWIFVKTRDGRFTGSSCFLFNPEALVRQRDALQGVMDARRSVRKLVAMWGLGFALKFMTHRLDIADAEKHLSEVLGLTGRAYVSSYPELAIDVDHPTDLPLVRERLAARLK